MSRTLLPRGALSAYSAAVDHVLRVDESTCRAEGVRISSGSFIPPILVGWFRPGGPRRRSARNEGAAAQAGFPRHPVGCPMGEIVAPAWCAASTLAAAHHGRPSLFQPARPGHQPPPEPIQVLLRRQVASSTRSPCSGADLPAL